MKKSRYKIYEITIIGIFLAVIWVPIAQMIFPVFEQIESTEKRVLSKLPEFDYRQLSKFFTDYENYFNDNFGLRNNLITLRSFMLFYVYSQSPSDYVVLGNKGMLFFAVGLLGDASSKKYSQEMLNSTKEGYIKEMKFLNGNNIYFLSIIAPDKHTIYSEYLPLNIMGFMKNNKLDQRLKMIEEIDESQEIDLRPALISAKNEHMLYYKTDTHWNNYGSFIAYQEIMNNLKRKYKNLEPLILSDFEITRKEKNGGDLAEFIGIPTYLKDDEVEFKLKDESRYKLDANKKLEKLIVYHDSFFDPKHKWGTINFLSNHFRETLSIPAYKAYDLYKSFDNERILKEMPDVVVYESVERDL